MNEGGMIKMYVEKQKINQADVASAIGIPENELDAVYESQTVAPDIKKKLQNLFNRNIFDGTLLTDDHRDTPDQNANRS